mmetsp:Transcript_52923/g.128362  ORF Transcript_52923/g.128362 Transcript_52923/m.128362 type:complete len:624 (+) Transcript_52923:209-2080(+)
MKFSSTAVFAATVFAAVSLTEAFTSTARAPLAPAAAVVSSVRPAFLPTSKNTQLFAATTTTESKPAAATKKDSKTKTSSGLATEDEIRGLFSLWNDALATGDSKIVASRYADAAVLLPTVSDTPRTDFDTIKDYFDAFLLQKPQGTILESYVTIGDDGTWAQDAGIYEFTMGASGKVVRARYTYTYVKNESTDGQWLIGHHHSSQMPEGIDVAEPIDEQQVRQLFTLWNDALATLDPSAVASRYADQAVLLPTVSDKPRTDYDGLMDYFTNFLQNKPQGTILESYVKIGTNWCKDSGIYEFKMGASGAVVKARYSFVYVYEDGQWKIAHHHSSQMPEEVEPKSARQTITEEEARDLFNLWNDALATGDPKKVAARYAKESILLPTVSDKPRTDQEGLLDYFTNFLKNKPQGVIKSGMVRTGENWAKDAGVYEFTMGADGSKVMARYSFVYVWEDGEWKIAHHHSSVMPEAFLKAAKDAEADTPTDKEVRDLFNLWNDALATGDPAKVAARYSKNAILLPTVSDTPRTTEESITDYFVSFLKNEPQGVIKEGVTLAGDGWAKDAGVYEFTMGANGSKVLARYSFVYVKEDGEWKIAHHHSSAMPEGMMAAAAKIKQLESVLLSK